MIICVCKAVSERQIRAAVMDGACCMRDLARDLGVGTCCGKCVPDAKLALSAASSRSSEACGPDYFSPAGAELAA